MKKFTILFLTFFLLSIPAAYAQRPVIALTFTAEYNNLHVPLDSIFIQNLTQPGDTMLFVPDTVLFLDYVSGVPDFDRTAKSSFSVSPNIPNPSVDGKTSIDVFIPERENVKMRIVDLLGREVVNYENTLDAGNHHFTFLAGKEKYYVLSVNCGNENRSIKMINSGNSNQEQGTLIYQGSTETEHPLKSQEAIAGFDFSLGDELQYTAFASGYQASIIVDIPESNKTYVFEMVSSVFTCGDIVTYEGQNYNTIVMGTQCWFLDNLNVGIMVTQNQTNNGVIEKYCYDNNPENCEIYGGLYDWGEVMQYSIQPGIQAICPTGWHIPTDEEFTTFTDYISNQPDYLCDNNSFNNAKAIATNTGWDTSSEYCAVGNDQSANNASGFSGMPVGMRMDNGSGYSGVGNTTAWYSSTESSSFASFGRMIAADYWFILSSMMSKNYGLSVRCLKNETSATIPTVTTSGITGITQTTATGGGEVTDDGGAEVTALGVCWSTTQNPTITDNHTSDGTGTGTFVSNLNGLTPNTPYFVRAYATNSVGTAYGNEVNFTTLSGSFTCGNSITINHVPGEVAPVDKTVTYGTVNNIPGEETKCWITSNLGADHQATAVDDATEPSAGWYWQFNRKQGYKHDGTTRTPNTTWISSISENSNWIPANDPCALELGAGWRIPTKIEWTNVDAAGDWTTWDGPWNSALKVHAAGYLTWSNGLLYERGNNGVYRSSTQYGIADLAWSLYFGDSWCEIAFDWGKSWGLSVRCVRDASASTIPIVSTSPVIEITQTTATSGGNVTADGGANVTARGVCWSTSQNPTIADSHTLDGTGTGTFVSNLTGLAPNTPYYVRAYATNSVGTAFGNEVNFTTLSGSFTCGSSLTINHVTGEVAPVDKTVTYGTVTNIPGEPTKCWITSNLGADHQATAKNDATEPSAGWYWQFNRKQGYKHTGTVRTPNTPWITSISEDSDWQPSNDPCTLELGADWRIPTSTEWTNVDASGNWTNWNGPWNSALKMHAAGYIAYQDGSLQERGIGGSYWSSTQKPTENNRGNAILFVSDWCYLLEEYKAGGFTLRCLNEQSTPIIPTVLTSPVIDITQTTATGGGNVTADGGAGVTARGVCWSTSQNPTIADSHTSDGTGTGVFVSNLTGLTPNTLYFARAYATNSAGTAYGNEETFTTLSAGFTCGDVVSYEGENYNTVLIGTQCWFEENLNVGTMIIAGQTQVNNGVIEKYCYENDLANCETYGGLYQWDEAMQYITTEGAQGICPPGWNIPTKAEYTILTDVLGGLDVAGGKMKETGTVHWAPPNTGATNESGFTGLPGGSWGPNQFYSLYNYGNFCTSTEYSSTLAYYFRLEYLSGSALISAYSNKARAISIRCIKYESSPSIPSVSTAALSNISQTTATGGGEVTDDGGADVTARGVCWNTTQNPTIYDSHTSDGTGTGAFVSNLTGLTPNTAYFVRAYATNSVGTAYGNEVNFTTLSAGFTCGSTITINHVTGEVAPVDKTVTYGTVTNIPGEPLKCWITSNLGADHQATAVNDATEPSAGWYWQFNRKQGYKHTGSVRTPNTTWISPINENSDWLPANDPCALELGAGWRLPTSTEWTNVDASGNWTNWNGPWNSALKMHAAGGLWADDGSLFDRGSSGGYWSSTQWGSEFGSGWFLEFSSSYSDVSSTGKWFGRTLRCIKE